VGDAADGFPGLPGWGPASAAALLARYRHLEAIPPRAPDWDVTVRGAARLAATLDEQRERARLFRTLATLRTDAAVGDVDALRWTGPRAAFAGWAERLGSPALHERAARLAAARVAAPRSIGRA
jgi:5'-3' exonuclease